MATGNARGGTPMANEIFEASAGFLVGTGEGAQVLLGGLALKCTVGRSSTPDQRRRAESVDISGCARRWKTEVSQHRFGDLAPRRSRRWSRCVVGPRQLSAHGIRRSARPVPLRRSSADARRSGRSGGHYLQGVPRRRPIVSLGARCGGMTMLSPAGGPQAALPVGRPCDCGDPDAAVRWLGTRRNTAGWRVIGQAAAGPGGA